jgi:uncharacterized phage-like protein YoqJ
MNDYVLLRDGTTMAIAFTGHRPEKIGGYDPINPMRQRVYHTLQSLIRATIESAPASSGWQRLNFISGMAQGIDQIAAEIVLQEKATDPRIHLIAAVPCRDQERQWPTEAQHRYHELLKQCDTVIMVTNAPYTFECMHIRNRWMVDHADFMIAVWDGIQRGGTARCVAYAVSKTLPVLHWNPVTNKIIKTWNQEADNDKS